MIQYKHKPTRRDVIACIKRDIQIIKQNMESGTNWNDLDHVERDAERKRLACGREEGAQLLPNLT